MVLDFKDGFVLREAGRQETVAGGQVLDVDPPLRTRDDRAERLRAWLIAERRELASLIVEDRGAIRASELRTLAGVDPLEAVDQGAIRAGDWLLAPGTSARCRDGLLAALADHHREHPLRPGLDVGEARAHLADELPAFSDPDLADAFLDHLAESGDVVRQGTTLRLAEHAPTTTGREDAARLVDMVRSGEPTPPSVQDLVAAGFGGELIRAACADGRLVRVSPEIVVTPEFLARAEEVVRARVGPAGVTVSGFREALGTTRKYALPILEFFDGRGLTRRQGDVRVLRQ